MDDHAGRITIIASSTMVQHQIRCMICEQPVDHRVVFLTNDARVLHAGCVPNHVKVPTNVLLQAIRRLERQLERARADLDRRGRRAPGPEGDGGRSAERAGGRSDAVHGRTSKGEAAPPEPRF